MAFASGPVSYQRFFATASLPTDIDDALMRRLNENSFGRLATLPDDTQHGWIGARHLLDTPIDAEQAAFGQFLLLGMRIDRLRAPSSILRAYVRVEEEAARQASGREFLSKGEQRKAREAALTRAEQEARSGAFRRMSSLPVLIDLAGGGVYLGGAGAASADRLMKLFADTFGVAVEPADCGRVAHRALAAAGRARALENLPPAHLAPSPGGPESDDGFIAGELAFLGREMLSWLWWQSERDAGPLRVSSGDEVTLMIDRTLRMQCDYGVSGSLTLTADGPTSQPEARAALRIGKQPRRAGLILGAAAGEFRLTLDAAKLAVSGLMLPDPQGEVDARARIEQRLEQVTEVAALLDALFEVFLLRRTAREWHDDAAAMTAWAAGQPRRPQRVASA